MNFSIDVGLIKALKGELPFTTFVETGTFQGDTIESIKDLFDTVYSVELSDDYYEKAVSRFQGLEYIRLYRGESPVVLQEVAVEVRDQSVLYFLDAHWCVADSTAGECSQCPLLGELKAIGTLNENSAIIIDDARLFLAPPLAPHEISQWPSFDEVLISLRALSPSHRVMVLNDTIHFYPKKVEKSLQYYGQQHGTDWLEVLHKTRDYENLREQFNGLLQQLHAKDVELNSLSSDVPLIVFCKKVVTFFSRLFRR